MSEKNMSEKVLDWFERNPTAKMRCGPLAKALKVGAEHLATTLKNLSDRGDLQRIKVEVKKEAGGTGGEQWEYWLPIGGKVIAPPPPYTPPKAFRRETGAQPATKTEETQSSTEQLEAKIEELQQEIRERKQGHALATETLSNQATKIEQLEQMLAERNSRITALEHAASLDKGLIEVAERGIDKASAMIDEVKVDMTQKLADAEARVVALESELIAAANRVSTELSWREPAGYVVATPNKPLRRTHLEKNALRHAMSAARSQGMAEVFAIYPVGKAIRGAEWKPKSW